MAARISTGVGSSLGSGSLGLTGRRAEGIVDPGHRPAASAPGWGLPARWAGRADLLLRGTFIFSREVLLLLCGAVIFSRVMLLLLRGAFIFSCGVLLLLCGAFIFSCGVLLLLGGAFNFSRGVL